MGSSLARNTGSTERARYGAYLSSNSWRARRRLYFEAVRAAGFEPACQVCLALLKDIGSLDLHHVSYDGVIDQGAGRFRSEEPDEDLVPLCREHHEALHKRLDDYRYNYWGWDRRRATVVIIKHMKRHLKAPKR